MPQQDTRIDHISRSFEHWRSGGSFDV